MLFLVVTAGQIVVKLTLFARYIPNRRVLRLDFINGLRVGNERKV